MASPNSPSHFGSSHLPLVATAPSASSTAPSTTYWMAKSLLTIRHGSSVTHVHDAAVAEQWISRLVQAVFPPPCIAAPPDTPESRNAVKNKVKAQIEFYLSDKNRSSDVFLRSRMNEEGWVPIGLLAGFRRVQGMTHDTSLILEAISSSPKLEMDADGSNVRLKDTW